MHRINVLIIVKCKFEIIHFEIYEINTLIRRNVNVHFEISHLETCINTQSKHLHSSKCKCKCLKFMFSLEQMQTCN